MTFAEIKKIAIEQGIRVVGVTKIKIVSANLDEFFMKRIGGLKQQVGAGLRELTLDGLTPLGLRNYSGLI